MPRGYLRTGGGNSRLRIVMPGYDADDPSVPPNKVVFDSDDIGTLSIIYSGTYTLTASGGVSNLQIASWPALPFVPLCLFRFRASQHGYSAVGYGTTWYSPDTSVFSRMIVSNSDIRLWYSSIGSPGVTIWWAVTRFAVV